MLQSGIPKITTALYGDSEKTPYHALARKISLDVDVRHHSSAVAGTIPVAGRLLLEFAGKEERLQFAEAI
jgi:hypothetical protein